MGSSTHEWSAEERLPRLRAGALVVLVLAVGAAFSAAAFFAIGARDRELVRLAFDHKAQMQAVAIRLAVDRGVDAADDMGALFDASQQVTREEFARFARHLLGTDAALQGLAWIPRVADAQRIAYEQRARRDISGYRFFEFNRDGKPVPAASHPEHFPIYYVEGRSSQQGLLGFDQAGDSARMDVLKRSRDSGRVVVTGRTAALGDTVLGNSSVVFFRPVYRKGARLDSPAQRRRSLAGFTSAAFVVGRLIGNVLDRLDERDVSVTLYDASAPPEDRLLAVWPGAATAQLRRAAGYAGGLRYAARFKIGGREWQAVFRARNGPLASATSLRAWGVLAAGLTISLLLAGYVSSEQRRLRVTREQAVTDPLTGLYNRRYLLELLPREISRAKRYRAAIAAVMLDIDRFKDVNDAHGHAAGDLVLRELGGLLKASVRESDMACRYGGEEFVLILPEASLDDVTRRAEALRRAVGEMRLAYRGRRIGPLSISLGIAMFPQSAADLEALLRCADYALYQAKRTGRDKVMAYTAPGASAGQVESQSEPRASADGAGP